MNYRAVLKYSLLAFVAVCAAYLMLQRSRSGDAAPDASLAAGPVAAAPAQPASEAAIPPSPPGQPGTEAAPAAQPAASRQRIRVYYFYTTVRCPTCRAIEAYTADTLRESFPEALSDGTVEWHPVNVQLPQNRHFIQDYQLFTKSVVISRVKDGRQVEWKNLERVWELAGNREAFRNYIRGEVRAYLGRS
jgi:hypothetical protein